MYSPYPRYSGGRENWLYNLSRTLVRRGVGVTIISHASNREPFYPLVDGVVLAQVPSIRYLDRAFFWANRLTLGLARALDMFLVYPLTAALKLARTKPVVLVCMNSIPEGLSAAIARRRYFVSVRGDVPSEVARSVGVIERPLRALERWVLRRAVRVLANGPDTQDRLRREGVESTVVPNGVDLQRFRSRVDNDMSGRLVLAAKGRPIIAVVGTLRPVKGTDDAIACAVELKRLGCAFLMAMVGKGDEAHYRRLAGSNDVDGAVEFFGETDEVPAVLQHADVFLALSRGSGLSMAVLEAMAAGVAVVAIDSPVYRPLIEHEVNGLLGGSPADLAKCCARMLQDADLRRRLGQQAAHTADAYDWNSVADRFLNVLDNRAAATV